MIENIISYIGDVMMLNISFTFKIIILTLLFYFLIPMETFAWDDCPLGEVNDEYPGDCAKYIDTDNDGICDKSQPAPENRDGTEVSNGVMPVDNDELHDSEYYVDISGRELKSMTVQEVAARWVINADELLATMIEEFDFNVDDSYTTDILIEDLQKEYKFSPAKVKDIAEEIRSKTDYDRKQTVVINENLNIPYNFGIPFFVSIILYIISWIGFKKELIKGYSRVLHNGIWNTVLIISLIP